jgi:hypothetical protein
MTWREARKRWLVAVLLLLLSIVVIGCVVVKDSPAPGCIERWGIPMAGRHPIVFGEMTPDSEIAADFRMMDEQPPVDLQRQNVVTTSEGHFRAFTVCDPALCQDKGCCQERLFVEDLGRDRTYEIQGLPLTWRPFSGLAWVRGDVLTFERWSQPAYGVHYAVDVGEGELLLAAPLLARSPDEQTDSRESER